MATGRLEVVLGISFCQRVFVRLYLALRFCALSSAPVRSAYDGASFWFVGRAGAFVWLAMSAHVVLGAVGA